MICRSLPALLLGACLLAQPTPRTAQAWMLALNEKGDVAPDLKPSEVELKLNGKTQTLTGFRTPAETGAAPQSWVLVFEPIRDFTSRAVAFTAAMDFLSQLPDGDRVFIVARGKDSLEPLLPGFSLQRTQWAMAMVKVPEMLPESLTGSPKETLQGGGFSPTFTDAADGEAGRQALARVLTTFRNGEEGWANGTREPRGVNLLDKLNFGNPTHVTGLISAVTREAKVLHALFAQLGPIPGQKHVIIFSRCEADDLVHPIVKRASTQKFKVQKEDLGGPAEAATIATRDMILLQAATRTKALEAGITLYSVAGSGQDALGHHGSTAQATGGFTFPLRAGLEAHFGGTIQAFGTRYQIQWTASEPATGAASLEIKVLRKGLRVFAPTFY